MVLTLHSKKLAILRYEQPSAASFLTCSALICLRGRPGPRFTPLNFTPRCVAAWSPDLRVLFRRIQNILWRRAACSLEPKIGSNVGSHSSPFSCFRSCSSASKHCRMSQTPVSMSGNSVIGPRYHQIRPNSHPQGHTRAQVRRLVAKQQSEGHADHRTHQQVYQQPVPVGETRVEARHFRHHAGLQHDGAGDDAAGESRQRAPS